ncbi:MAG: FHA domain-containing protein [bacterium]|nr:FHA domain-containing protein [bacterium]MBU1917785.1 FHA domain-containing protein [bacterium]
MLNIVVTNRETNKKQQYKFVQHAIIIGRQQNCDITLESTRVSRRHAKITVNKDLVEVEDLGSGNGTVVNHQRIAEHKKVPIKKSDRLRIDEFEIELELTISKDPLDKASKIDVTDPDIIEIKMIKKVLGALDQDKLPAIVIVSDDFPDKKAFFEAGMDELDVGRDETCSLSLDSNVISRKHAILTVKWGQFVLIDKKSKNGTFVNGERIQEKSVKDGDEIVFGTIKAIFKNPKEFDIEAITKSISDEKQKESLIAIDANIAQKQSVSDAAKASVNISKQNAQQKADAQSEPEVKPEEKGKKKTKKYDEQDILGDMADKEFFDGSHGKHQARKKTTALSQAKKQASKITTTESLLFMFGGVVIIIVVLSLLFLFM